LAAGTPGKRFALENSRILIHQPSAQGEGQSSDIEIQAREILRVRALQETMLARHTGRTETEIRRDTERDKIFSADEAEEYGLIDEVIMSRKAARLLSARSA
ncbi:ATP-dependent Clp protease proteolytic subunit, partial [Frankia sp. CgS1]